MKSSPLPLLAALGLVLPIFPSFAPAQDTSALWKKDVVVLVDVSKSVHPSAAKEAENIIKAMVNDELILSKFPKWTLGEVHYDKYRQMLDSQPSGTKLTSSGHYLLVLPFGNEATVLQNHNPRQIDKFPGDFNDYLDRLFPREWNDGWTHYYYAQARARHRMAQISPEGGYYLFVVSDAQDDPGPKVKNPYDQDTMDFIKQWRQEKDEHLIAKLDFNTQESDEARDGKKRPMKMFSLWLMGIGFDPAQSPPPEVVAAPVEIPKPPELVKLDPRLEFIGGLAGLDEQSAKVFTDPKVFIAWQTRYLPREARDFDIKIEGEGGTNFSLPSYRPKDQDPSISRAELPPLEEGLYRLEVRSLTDKNDTKATVSGTTFIRIVKPIHATPWLAAASGVLSLGIFGTLWWRMRQSM